MFYDCGSVDNYSYIFDTEDGSCELVKQDSLVDIEINKLADRGSLSPVKLKMLFGFKDYANNSMMYRICTYYINENIVLHVRLHIRLVYLSKDVKYYTIRTSQEYKDFCYNGYMLFLVVTSGSHDMVGKLCSKPNFRHLVFNYVDYLGIQLPLQMLPYMNRLAKEHNFYELDRAFGGFIFSNLTMLDKGGFWKTNTEKLDEDNIFWEI